jgi:hypothetical protein
VTLMSAWGQADGGELCLWTCELSAWCVPSVVKIYCPSENRF